MRIFSFYKKGLELAPVEIEISLMRGLPQFQFMGLPDMAIKESQLKIRSALKRQGYTLPKAEQILVNLKPGYVKKSSRGIELAVAAAFLWKTGQIPNPESCDKVFLYGELGLDGKVYVPDDLDSLVQHDRKLPIWSGIPRRGMGYSINAVSSLNELGQPKFILGEEFEFKMQRPVLMPWYFSKQASRLIEIVATGEHPVMLAGPAGSGKTTLAEAIHQCLSDPSYEQFLMSSRINKLVGQKLHWRPYVAPHHTTPPLSMVGGGVPPFPGEITRAHGGTLVMDEFLEFPSKVREALREPVEKGEIVVARRGRPQVYPAQVLLIATSNLCHCGDLVPGRTTGCRYSLVKCRSYSERLSGPILDRFHILSFSHKWGVGKEVDLSQIVPRIRKARDFALKARKQSHPNGRLSESELMLSSKMQHYLDLFPQQNSSRRRLKAILRVARSIADLEGNHEINLQHYEEAMDLCWRSFEEMKR
ncbi:MAG: ATP-binding protein, partial [Bdellovibrionales bacterium]|nr:ATP-binding protein [Bdellovibrionales bacterium]